MEFEELLKSLANACGIERLEPDELRRVHLGSGRTALTIVGNPETRTVVLFSEIGDLPLEGRAAFYEQALQANWLFQGGCGASLAISPESGVLSLNRSLPTAALHGELFVEVVRRFVIVLGRWRKLARDWREAIESGEINAKEVTSGSGRPAQPSFGNESLIKV